MWGVVGGDGRLDAGGGRRETGRTMRGRAQDLGLASTEQLGQDFTSSFENVMD